MSSKPSSTSLPFTLPFTKMNGLGNDFIVIDSFGNTLSGNTSGTPHTTTVPQDSFPLDSNLARKICDRRFGVGADQILWLKKPESSNSDVRMDILNADGSVAEMCGNGIRAVAVYLKSRYFSKGPSARSELRIETLAGIKTVSLRKGENGEDQVKVNMGAPQLGAGFQAPETLTVADSPAGGLALQFHEVNVGNPHAVIFTRNLSEIPLSELGPKVENHPRFPLRTNVEWVQVLGPDSIRIRVWERGAGETLACGTGACASAVAALATGRVQGELKVHLPGGLLRISWAGGAEPIWMEGPAEEVFQGVMRVSS